MGSHYARSLRAVELDAQRLANHVLEIYNVTSYPVSLSRILAGERATVEDMYGRIHGALTPTARGYTISVSRSLGPHRRRFTIAHELGHLLLGRARSRGWYLPTAIQKVVEDVPVGGPAEERFCNAFASYLLIPDQALGKFTAWDQITMSSLIHAALELDVAPEPLIWRVLELLPFNGGLLMFRIRRKPNDYADIQLRLDSGRFPKHPEIFVPRHASAPELYRAAKMSADELLQNVKLHLGRLKGTRSLLVWRSNRDSAQVLDRSATSDGTEHSFGSDATTGTWRQGFSEQCDATSPTAEEIGLRLMAIVVPPEVDYTALRTQGYETPRLQFEPQPSAPVQGELWERLGTH